MKLASLLFTISLPCAVTVWAQDLNLLEPGDILIVKAQLIGGTTNGKVVTKVEAISEDGSLRPPHLPGITSSESVTVWNVSVDEAISRLQSSYNQTSAVKLREQVQISIERGTASQLLEK
jgi:hypothetical protein